MAMNITITPATATLKTAHGPLTITSNSNGHFDVVYAGIVLRGNNVRAMQRQVDQIDRGPLAHDPARPDDLQLPGLMWVHGRFEPVTVHGREALGSLRVTRANGDQQHVQATSVWRAIPDAEQAEYARLVQAHLDAACAALEAGQRATAPESITGDVAVTYDHANDLWSATVTDWPTHPDEPAPVFFAPNAHDAANKAMSGWFRHVAPWTVHEGGDRFNVAPNDGEGEGWSFMHKAWAEEFAAASRADIAADAAAMEYQLTRLFLSEARL